MDATSPPAEGLPDGDLLARAHGHPDLLGTIYTRHASAVFRYLARRVGQSAAEDLLGDVFVAAVAARSRVRPHSSGSALPWLYGIAGNVVRAYLRRESTHRQAGRAAGSPDTDTVGCTVDWDAVDDRLDAAARRQDLRTALAGLTDAEREVLLLVAWEGLTPAEAARALGLNPVAARSRLHRARSRAQASLDRLTLASTPANRTVKDSP